MSKIVWKELVSKFSCSLSISEEIKINEEDLLNNENKTKNYAKKFQNEVKKKKMSTYQATTPRKR